MRNFTSVTKQYYLGSFDSYIVIENNIPFTVPLDPANTDYQAVQEWIANGGTVIDNGGGE